MYAWASWFCRCIIEVNRREADICAIQMDIEQIQEREQLLTAENVLLKVSFLSYQILSFKFT